MDSVCTPVCLSTWKTSVNRKLILQIGFAAIIIAAVAAILALGKPVVDYTFSVFPTGATEEGLYSP